jgi:hypothetical protein
MIALIFLGCMSFSFGGHYDVPPDGEVLTQKGQVTVKGGCEQDVYYPVPYASPPNLDANDTFDHAELLEQRADHFRVRNTSALAICVNWKARGVRCLGTPAVAPVPAPAPAPAATDPPPPEPVPLPAQLTPPRQSPGAGPGDHSPGGENSGR